MNKQWLIDAYNVMHRLTDVEAAMNRDISEARRIMAEYVEQLCRRRSREAFLVFDGAPGRIPIRKQHVRIYYSYPHDADTLIKQLVGRNREGQRWIVVTDDRAIRRAAALTGAELMSAARFCSLLTAKTGQTIPKKKQEAGTNRRIHTDRVVSDTEVEEMLRLLQAGKGDDGGRP